MVIDEFIQPINPFMYTHPVVVSSTPTWAAVLEAIAGFGFGFAMAQMDHLWACISESDDMLEKLIDSGYKFAAGTYDSVAQAFHDLGDFTTDIKMTIYNCPKTSEDAAHWGELSQTFDSWGVFVYTVSVNLIGDDFWNEVHAIGDSARADDWFSYGAHMGAATDLLIKPVDLSPYNPNV